ncbi:DUF4271 domain-containing protein [Flagellimonas nanhaiensis]|uniref:DUF4271 domain-containing protein n=1 Tax=Flagellimonas nanhaiensis TaxID=2292706 RepID=A0A371JPR1_9FLAO|nr:DUF4271 domain-containing protein [Allomuricauda nanhaiensis]RDY59502.1 DUF4271 domain-containing protein [Allomuricauda nanhaiensis]
MNPVDRVVFSLDWITITLFLSMILLTLGKYLFQSRFMNFMILPFNDKYILLHNKKGQLLNWFHILLTLFQLLNLSLFLFLIQKHLLAAPLGDDQIAFFWILGFLTLFELAKLGVQYLKGFIFETSHLISELIFHKISYLNFSSLIMLIGNIVVIYILNDSKMVIYATILLVLAINGIGVIKLLKNYQKALIPHVLYFILYLCTLEIAPLVLIGSYLKD